MSKKRKYLFRAIGLLLRNGNELFAHTINIPGTHERNRQMKDDQTEEINKEELSRLKSLDIVAFNQVAEDLFVEIVKLFLQEEGPQPVSSVCAEAAFELDISIETAKRYLSKHTARRAEFKIEKKKVSLR